MELIILRYLGGRRGAGGRGDWECVLLLNLRFTKFAKCLLALFQWGWKWYRTMQNLSRLSQNNYSPTWLTRHNFQLNLRRQYNSISISIIYFKGNLNTFLLKCFMHWTYDPSTIFIILPCLHIRTTLAFHCTSYFTQLAKWTSRKPYSSVFPTSRSECT